MNDAGRGLPPGAGRRLAGFVRLLRREGFGVGVAETLDGLRALDLAAAPDSLLARSALRSLACQDPDQWRRFEDLFEQYWFPGRTPREDVVSAAARIDPRMRRRGQAGITGLGHSVPTQTQEDGAEADEEGGGAGRQTTLTRADFRFLSDRRAARQVERLAERLALRIRRRLVRRRRETGRGRRLHLKRTFRRSLATGGMPMHLRYLERRREPPRLVLLHDVSHSMAGYNPLYTRYVRGLMRVFRECETFVFHTRLYHVTDLYRERDPDLLRRRLERLNDIWLGGTRIADSLAAFRRDYAGRLLNRRTVVIILSDGFDTDDPQDLAAVLADLKERAGRVIWLNPMLGRPGFNHDAPELAVIRPHLDWLAPAHSLKALERVTEYLAGH